MLDDLKFACKRLWHAPGSAAVAALTLALAIGVNTAIFAFADAVLFRPLPYTDPDRLHIVQMLNPRTGNRYTLVPGDILHRINEHHRGLGAVASLGDTKSIVMYTDEGTEGVETISATANYFELLGVQPVRGRLFDAGDADGASRAAVLTYGAWQRWFGGDDRIVGRPVTLGLTTVNIVGVLPRDFVFPSLFVGRPQLVTIVPHGPLGTTSGAFHPIVRRETGVTREQAQAELDALVAPLLSQNPRIGSATPVLEDVRSVIYPAGRAIMRFLLASATLVLLIGCANLANMLLARTLRRQRETAVRAALGAGPLRLARPLIFESAIVGLVAAALAVAVTTATFDLLAQLVPPIAHGNAPVGVNLRVVIFALSLGFLGGLLFAIIPAWRSTRLDVQALIQGRHRLDAGHGARLGGSMVTLQVALAVVLVFGAVIAARAFVAVLQVPLGFTPENVLTIRFRPRGLEGSELQSFYVRAATALGRRSEVVSVGAAGTLPLDGSAADESARTPGTGAHVVGIVHVLPGYFETLDIPLVRGRLLDWDDMRDGADVSVLTESAARALFPGHDPLGGTFQNRAGRRFTIIGIVRDVRRSLDLESEPVAHVIPEDATRNLTLVVRMRTRQHNVLAEIKRQVAALLPGTPVEVGWWSDYIKARTEYRNPRFQTLVLGTFAVLALALTGLGIFSVISFLVALRTQEMGVRLAMGATPRSLLTLLVNQALLPVFSGLIIGLVTTRWLSRFAEAQLYQVDTRDAFTLAAAAFTVVTSASIAAYLPARHASRVDPMIVLRAE
jgi:predicted permease